MAGLTSSTIASTYTSLIRTLADGGITTSLQVVEDGAGVDTCLQLSTKQFLVKSATDIDATFDIQNSSSHQLLTIDTVSSPEEVVINEGGLATIDFRVESDGEDEALFMDASANTLYINKGETAFTTSIHSTNDVAMTIGSAGVVFNEDGHATNDFRVESDDVPAMLCVDAGANAVGIGTSDPNALLHVEADNVEAKVYIMRGFETATDDPGAIGDDAVLGSIWFGGQDSDSGADPDGCIIKAVTDGAWTGSARNAELQFWTQATTTPGQRMTIDNDGNVGIGITAPAHRLESHTAAADNVSALRLYASSGSFVYTLLSGAVNKAANANYKFLTFDDDNPTRQMDVDGTGVIRGHSSPVGTVDYAEFFESTDGSEISLGTTVVLDNGKVRKAVDGEIPFGVVSSTEGNGGAPHKWNQYYLKDDYGKFLTEDNGNLKVNPDWEPDGYDDSELTDEQKAAGEKGIPNYTPRRFRDEWNSIGLLGQVPITKGEVLSSSWIKMREISDTVDMYFIK